MSKTRRFIILTACCLFKFSFTHQQTVLVSTTTQPSNSSGPSGIEKQVLGPLRVWHIVAIVCTFVLIGLVLLCYCYDYRIPRSRTEIAENHRKRQMNKKYLFMLERKPEDVLSKSKEAIQQPTHARAVSTINARALASYIAKPQTLNKTHFAKTEATNKSHNAKTDALNKVRNAVRATSLQKPTTSGGIARSSRLNDDPDYFTSAVKPRPKTGLETPLASHPKDLLSLMKKKTFADRRD